MEGNVNNLGCRSCAARPTSNVFRSSRPRGKKKHEPSVESTFFHASAPPRTSSTSFLLSRSRNIIWVATLSFRQQEGNLFWRSEKGKKKAYRSVYKVDVGTRLASEFLSSRVCSHEEHVCTGGTEEHCRDECFCWFGKKVSSRDDNSLLSLEHSCPPLLSTTSCTVAALSDWL